MPTPTALRADPIEEAARQWRLHGWADAAPSMAIVTSIMRVHQLLLHRVETELRPFELSFARYEVLMLLTFSRTGALPLGKVGNRLQVQPGAVTNAIDRLQAQGLVTRRPHPTDGRTTLAVITRRGRSVARRATAVLNSAAFGDLGLTRQQTDQLFSLLRRIRMSAGDFDS